MNLIQNYEIEKILKLTISDPVEQIIHQLRFFLILSTYRISCELWLFNIYDQVRLYIFWSKPKIWNQSFSILVKTSTHVWRLRTSTGWNTIPADFENVRCIWSQRTAVDTLPWYLSESLSEAWSVSVGRRLLRVDVLPQHPGSISRIINANIIIMLNKN